MVTYSLKQCADGSWSVCRLGFSLFSDLRLGAAIKLAREVARDEHLRSGRSVCVEMPGVENAIRLAQYARPAKALERAA
ncbi:hypothetical protein [Dyella japonica]|uniref:Uncharacterized protein n=1 Tax=Dyella japonica A8 TaxID=1217721 RepID=A0A075K2G1_9GAMM|nr:hypothetical protein [Dyella japonica]AIF47897.1 hypothetical protein HY57_11800 [Dyella japonica A8]